nr:hypothetical protein [Tanacetum cinerariifolium]
ASGSQSQDNIKNDKIQQTPRKAKKTKLEDHLRPIRHSLNKKSVVGTKATSSVTNSISNVNFDLKCASCNGCLFSDNHDACVVAYINSVNASIKSKSITKPVVQIVLWYLDYDCSKHMTGDQTQLINFVHKFLGTVKFGNDHVAKIMGYGDYHIGNVTISRVYYVEGLGHNLFSVGQFCDSDLEVAFCQHTCFIRNLDGVDLLTGSRGNNLYTLSQQDMMASSPICLSSKASKTKSWLWHCRTENGTEFVNQTLQDYYEEVGISHETSVARSPHQNGVVERQAVATACFTQNRSIIRLRHGKTPYELLHNKLPDLSFFHCSRRITETIHVDFDELTAMASAHRSSGPALHEMTSATISSGLVQKSSSSTPFVPPSRNDWDLLFQPMFDELLNPLPSIDHQVAQVIAPIAEVIRQVLDDSTGSPSSTTVDQDEPFASKSHTTTEIQSSVIPPEVEEDNLDIEVAYMGNDPLFGVPVIEVTYAQSSSTTYKDALTQSCWIEAMKEELNEFERLEVWELIPRLDKVMVITLKWIYKVKLDELGGILKNKARLVARGYRQEEGLTLKSLLLRVEVYVSQPDGFVDQANPNHVYKLKKALYGLKQAPRAWYDMLSSFLITQDFSKGSVDPTLFICRNGNDLLLISQSPRGIFINQSKYALESLKKYSFESCDLVDTPMVEKSELDEDKEGKAVDPSHYRASRPDLQFAICIFARYQAQPTEKHCTILGERLISWSSKRQKSAAISSTEAECIVLSGCCAQILWMRSQLSDYGLGFNKIPMYCDNKSAIALCCNNVQHSRSKHIDIRYHFINEQVENGVIELYFVNIKYQLADLFTKALGLDRIEFLINNLGMISFTPETLKQLMDDVDE